jgi:GcrA cell cycle regulator
MSWNDERVETLKRLWNQGLSASQIAGELGHGITRNAVIGKVHRLGLIAICSNVKTEKIHSGTEPSDGALDDEQDEAVVGR